MKIDSMNVGMPWLTGASPETTKADPAKPAAFPVAQDTFEILSSFGLLSKNTTGSNSVSSARYYNAARTLSASGQTDGKDDAWREFLGAGTLIHDLRRARWVSDLFQGFNLSKSAKAAEGFVTHIPTPVGKLPIVIPKPAIAAIEDVATPAGKLAVATVAKASPLAKIAEKAAPLARVAGRLGRVVGRAVPFVNVGLAALDVHDAVKIAQDPKASTAKKVLGFATAAASTLSVIPGIGLLFGLGAAGLGIARDNVK